MSKRPSLLLARLSQVPSFAWVLLGFVVPYLLFFVYPIFFSASTMQFGKYVPAMDPIGADLRQMLSYSQSWCVEKASPYIGANLYPPLASVLFAPLVRLPVTFVYRLMTAVTLLCYGFAALAFPLRVSKGKQGLPLLVLLFITGLFSYGLQFEIERGQFNVIAVACSFAAIWICHNHGKYRYLAYCLFSIAVQLKVYPFVFIVMLVRDWRDWRGNVTTCLALSAANVALLFVLGPRVFLDFVSAISTQMADPLTGPTNHSVRSAVYLIGTYVSTWVGQHAGVAELALLAICGACILVALVRAYRENQSGVNSHLLLACTIGALVIPSVSHDYTLPLLVGPVAILLSDVSYAAERDGRRNLVFILLLVVLSTAYFSTVFPLVNKPFAIRNNCPALFAMLLAVTGFFLWSGRRSEASRNGVSP
jgi:hypothetical protein